MLGTIGVIDGGYDEDEGIDDGHWRYS